MELPRINIARSHHRVLSQEFPGRSKQFVNDALNYRSMSPEAKRMRKRAFELLRAEASKELNYINYEQ